MNKPLRERTLSAAVFGAAVILIAVLALLQYRWINQVSQATSLRLADSLQRSMIEWHQELFRDLSQICFVFALDSENTTLSDSERFSHSLLQWKSITAYPDLIANLYIIGPSSTGPELLRFNPDKERFEAESWPANLSVVYDELSPSAAHPATLLRQKHLVSGYYPGGPISGWQFEPSAPALLHPITRLHGEAPDVHRWILIEINSEVLRNRVMTDLAQRYFEGTDGLDFQVAVLAGNPKQVVYSSDSGFGSQEIVDADGTMNVFGRGRDNTLAALAPVFQNTRADRMSAAAFDVLWFPLFSDAPPDNDWQLLVRHRRGGPLGAFTAELHQRDLALSFGILVLLLLSMLMLLISTRRAQHLARLQMEFVATVSHELRTPLTVIGTAADNITSGVVESRTQIMQYGSLIQAHTRQLSALVEQVLTFAASRQERQQYHLHALNVTELIQSALVHATELSGFSPVTAEQEIEPDLPPVWGDANAVSQCLQNLINNAIKYGGKEKWIGIRAKLDPTVREVEISICDHGLGIAPADLPHIFEPFYRSSLVISEQIRGTGLGLALAKGIAEAMKGQLMVSSVLGKGSAFTLRLPCAEASSEVRQSSTS
jgi:signal transduction histidine kinase